MNDKPRELTSRGARGGIVLGGWFCATFALMAGTGQLPLLAIPAVIMMVSVPVVAYRMLLKSYRSLYGMTTMSALWLEGILSFMGGSLFLAVGAFLFLKYIDPEFIVRQTSLMADYYAASEETRSIGETFRRMIENHMLPRPIEAAFSLAWLSAFAGALTSLVLAAVIKRFGLRKSYDNR